MEIAITILLVAFAIGKATVNRDPDKSEEEETAETKAGIKHQGWQTLDWTEPWNGP